MKYIEKSDWKASEKAGDLKNTVALLFGELRENCELVEVQELSKERSIIRTLYYSVAYKRHTVMCYSDDKLLAVLEELKVIRSYMMKEMKKLK